MQFIMKKQISHFGLFLIFLSVLPSISFGCRLWAIIENGSNPISSSSIPVIMEEIETLYQQGHLFRDGWGLAFYYHPDSLISFRSPKSTADDSSEFWNCVNSNIVDSTDVQLALGHVRATTSGAGAIPNPHPFIFQNNSEKFSFIHNGTISKSLLYDLITEYGSNTYWIESNPPQTYGNGDWRNEGWSKVVDSELYFLLIMKLIEETDSILNGIQKAITQISNFTPPAQMNFIMSNGQSLYAYGGQSALSYTDGSAFSHKAIMSRPPETGIASEITWIPIQKDELIVLSGNTVENYETFSGYNSGAPYFIQSEFSIRPCFPNPFNNEINIKFNSGPFNTIQLSIYNIVGRIIWSEIVSTQEDQIIQKTWTGKNEHDDPMPSGQYYVQIRSGDQAKTQKIIYLK
jgi:hypothetical protein